MKRKKRNSDWLKKERRLVAYLDGLSERVNALRRLVPIRGSWPVTGGVGCVVAVRVG